MQTVQPFAPGDRVPNFRLPDQDGMRRSFYHELKGKPIILLACRDPEGPVAAGLLRAAARLEPALRAEGIQVFVLSATEIARNKQVCDALGLEFPIFMDRAGASLGALLAPGVEARSYLLDANQRILTIAEDTGEAALEGLLKNAKAQMAAIGAALVLQRPAPVLILPEVLDPNFCRQLIDLWRAEHHEGAVSTGGGNTYKLDGKRTLEHVVDKPELRKRISMTLARRIGPELSRVFNYSAPFIFDSHVVMSYQPQRADFFGLHRDDLREEMPRRFAMSLNLNDEFEGGELIFPEYSDHRYKMPAGAGAIFSVSLLHAAVPVTQGQRWVLTSFFCDPPKAAGQNAEQRMKQVRL